MSEEIQKEQTTETVQEETPQAQPQEQPQPQETPKPTQRSISSGLKAIMDREAAIRERETQLKRTAHLQEEVDRLKGLAKTNPFRFLEEHGVTLDRLEELKTEASDPTKSLRRELEDIKNTIQIQNQRVDQERQQAQLSQARNAVVQWLQKSDRFPFVKAAGASDLVFQRMLNHWEQTGEELSEEEAASEVDNQIKGLASKLTPLLGDRSDEKEDVTESTTLTNELASSGPRSGKKLSREDALYEAAKQLRYIGEN